MEDIGFEFRHVLGVNRFPIMQAFKCAQHIAEGVTQFAVVLDGGFQDFGADAHVVGIVAGGHPEAQNIRAGVLDDFLRHCCVAERF